MSEQELLDLINKVAGLIEYPEVDGETYLADWIADGDVSGMTAEQIAAEWDKLSSQKE